MDKKLNPKDKVLLMRVEEELKAMGYGYKSPQLFDITPNIERVDYRIKARLSLEEQANGSIKIIPHPQQQQIDLENPFLEIILPNDAKENLLATGNSGQVVELEPAKRFLLLFLLTN